MKFNANQQDLQQALNYCQGVIEKRSTLPILSNILLEARDSKLTITATDLDLIFIHVINNIEVLEEGKTTTTSSIMYDIIRKFSSGKKINLTLTDISKLHLESEKSIFNLNFVRYLFLFDFRSSIYATRMYAQKGKKQTLRDSFPMSNNAIYTNIYLRRN